MVIGFTTVIGFTNTIGLYYIFLRQFLIAKHRKTLKKAVV